MKLLKLLAACLATASFAVGAPMVQQPQPATPPASPQLSGSTPATPKGSLSTGELEELLGPIALYPDDLLANVLAASVYPDEVAQAANFVKAGGDKKVIDSRDWEQPVKTIANIPDVAKMMGEYPDWVTALGQAYLTQAQDVMRVCQELRRKASANGALLTTPQQVVQEKDGNVTIIQSDPEIVYVPSYSPSVVYVDDDDDEWAAAAIGFGTGIAVGALVAGLHSDWHGGSVSWGHGDVNINNNFNRNTNINNIGNGNRAGREGGAWSPNKSKPLATSRPSQAGNFRSSGPGAGTRSRAPAASSAGRTPAPTAAARRGGAGGSTRSPSTAQSSRVSAPPGGATRTPSSMPSQQRAAAASGSDSAFRGGSDTRASSSRGSSSRESAQRSYGGGSSPARSSGGSRSGGGGRGGGRR